MDSLLYNYTRTRNGHPPCIVSGYKNNQHTKTYSLVPTKTEFRVGLLLMGDLQLKEVIRHAF